MIIDSHHHFWNYTPAEYGWIDDAMAAIRRDFLPADLGREMAAAGVDGVVSVQARQSVEETRWLLDLAARHEFIRGVVGWVPLTAPDVREMLEELAGSPRLKAVRHVLQGEADDYMLRGDFNAGIRALRPLNLAYDILIVERQLPSAIRLVDQHPEQVFILDHIAKPRIRDGAIEPWAAHMRELARRPNVFCKLSGMVTEADYGAWTPQRLRPYMDIALDAFGPTRLMFGSDWPVCLVACDYARWVRIVRDMTSGLSPAERQRVMAQTAIEAYRL